MLEMEFRNKMLQDSLQCLPMEIRSDTLSVLSFPTGEYYQRQAVHLSAGDLDVHEMEWNGMWGFAFIDIV